MVVGNGPRWLLEPHGQSHEFLRPNMYRLRICTHAFPSSLKPISLGALVLNLCGIRGKPEVKSSSSSTNLIDKNFRAADTVLNVVY